MVCLLEIFLIFPLHGQFIEHAHSSNHENIFHSNSGCHFSKKPRVCLYFSFGALEVLDLGVALPYVHTIACAFPHGGTKEELVYGGTIKGFPFAMRTQPPVNSYLSLRTGKNLTSGKDMSIMRIP